MNVYRITASWHETTATWTYRTTDGTSVTWTTAGGDYVGSSGSPYATSYANPGDDDPVTWDVTDLAKEWQDGTYSNYGLLIKSQAGNRLHFHSREASDASLRPVLTVTYVPLPSAALAGLGLLALVGVACLVRRRR